MKRIAQLAGILAILPGTVSAQSRDDATFSGIKIGGSIDYRWHDGDYTLPRIVGRVDENRGGIGFRGHAGFDAQIGEMLLIGAEGGIGRGGSELKAASPAGDYVLKPRWTWDVSARAGILPAPSVLVYGRAGYSWLRVRETTDFRATNLADLKTSGTEAGFLWGAGLETALMPGVFTRVEYDRANYRDGLTSSKIQLGMSVGF